MRHRGARQPQTGHHVVVERGAEVAVLGGERRTGHGTPHHVHHHIETTHDPHGVSHTGLDGVGVTGVNDGGVGSHPH